MKESNPENEAALAARFGFSVALATGLATVMTFGLAVATPPLSGPMCRAACFDYPYSDIVSRFPRDYYWMFPAIPAALLSVAWATGLHARTPPERRIFSRVGVVFAAMAATVIVADYYLQLAIVQPSALAHESQGLALVTQYNPHGVFIALEELGYLLMSTALACFVPAIRPEGRVARALRTCFAGGFVVTLALLAGFLVRLGHRREYMFEIAVITVDWVVVIAGSFLSAVLFRRDASATRARS